MPRGKLVAVLATIIGVSCVASSSGVAAALPDGRAYEVVSPADKNGADVAHTSQRTRAAADGGAVQFSSSLGFGDVRGASLVVEYVAVRERTGWATHAITPGGLQPLSFFDTVLGGLDPRYIGPFSADLRDGVFLSNTPLTADSPFTDGAPNIYIRSDLRTPGAGDYSILSKCPGCSGPLPASPADQPWFAAASADYSHVLLESMQSLTNDVAVCNPGPFGSECFIHLYEWHAGTLRLAGLIPPSGNTQCGPAPLEACVVADSSEAGQGAMSIAGFSKAYTADTISHDGSRIVFTVPSVVRSGQGDIYMRTGNGTPLASTVQVNASERGIPDAPAPAIYWAATPDGSKILFTSDARLTNDDAAGLYMYDADASSGHRLSVIGSGVNGVIGVSDDGSYVYFVAQGRIFVWHDGVSKEVADVTPNASGVVADAGWLLSPKASRISPDGARMVFATRGNGSTAELPHSGTGDGCVGFVSCQEVFVYDATADGGMGRLTCVSCQPGNPDAPSETDASFSAQDQPVGSATSNRPLANDGRFVFFTTGNRLVEGDENNVDDVYEYGTNNDHVYLLSSGAPGSLGSQFMDASTNGHDVFFTTRDRLVRSDNDQQVDLYDARVGGGFPESAPSPVPCAGDACRGSTHDARSFVKPSSSTLTSAGNVKAKRGRRPAKHCRKTSVRRRVHGRVKCVKRRHRSRATRADARKAGW